MNRNYFLILIVLVFYSCQKELSREESDTNSNTNTSQQVDVYVAGYENGSGQYPDTTYATYWKNGKAFRLDFDYPFPDDPLKQGWANSIAVSGNDIYVSGYRHHPGYLSNDYTQGLYWKNGAAFELPRTTRYNRFGPIIISNNDFYIVNKEILGPTDAPYYLKNGNEVYLDPPGGQQGSITYAIAVSGSNVYLAGAALRISNVIGQPYYFGTARYWKNGIPVNLTDGTFAAYATAIAVSDNDVYAAGVIVNGIFVPAGTPPNGNTNARGIYWKNGQPFYFTDGTADVSINSMVVSGNDVYIAGTQSDGTANSYGIRKTVAKYWKNGVAIKLTDGSKDAEARSIVVSGNDVYVAGFEYDGKLTNGFPASVAKYWKNGQPINLTDGTSDAAAYSIFLVKK